MNPEYELRLAVAANFMFESLHGPLALSGALLQALLVGIYLCDQPGTAAYMAAFRADHPDEAARHAAAARWIDNGVSTDEPPVPQLEDLRRRVQETIANHMRTDHGDVDRDN